MNLSFNELQDEEAKISAKKIQHEEMMQDVRAGNVPSTTPAFERRSAPPSASGLFGSATSSIQWWSGKKMIL
jgi:hypothetical protein